MTPDPITLGRRAILVDHLWAASRQDSLLAVLVKDLAYTSHRTRLLLMEQNWRTTTSVKSMIERSKTCPNPNQKPKGDLDDLILNLGQRVDSETSINAKFDGQNGCKRYRGLREKYVANLLLPYNEYCNVIL